MTDEELYKVPLGAKIWLPATIEHTNCYHCDMDGGKGIDTITLHIDGIGRVTMNPWQLRNARHENQA